MATTAIFAELLVVGLQVLVWLTIAVFGVTRAPLSIPSAAHDWSTLITLLVIAAAYVLGVLMDRISDSVFKHIDADPVRRGDPKVSIARLTVASRSEPVWRFLEYVRSRLRIARATTLNLAIGTVATAFLLVRQRQPACCVAFALIAGTVAVCLALWVARRISKTYYERLMEAHAMLTDPPKPAE
jgi:hypothetical protein